MYCVLRILLMCQCPPTARDPQGRHGAWGMGAWDKGQGTWPGNRDMDLDIPVPPRALSIAQPTPAAAHAIHISFPSPSQLASVLAGQVMVQVKVNLLALPPSLSLSFLSASLVFASPTTHSVVPAPPAAPAPPAPLLCTEAG